MTRGSSRAPYALAPTDFPLPALAAMAGHAPLGGPRELALACFVVCRLVVELRSESALTPEQWRTRIHGGRHWLGSTAIAGAVKSSLTRLLDALAGGDRRAVSESLAGVIAVTAIRLEPAARLELGRLAQGIAE
jgi:hypothetical protein